MRARLGCARRGHRDRDDPHRGRGRGDRAGGRSVFGGGPAASGPDATLVRYDRDVRRSSPTAASECHGRDESKRRAKLRLDDAANAVESHARGTPIVAGRPGRERGPRPHRERRPEAVDAAARQQQAAVRRRRAGADPPLDRAGGEVRGALGLVPAAASAAAGGQDAAWCATPVDRFVLANLEREGVAPGPEAPPETQLRRLFLDLTGLPPTPEELDAYLADARPDAWERQVDRLFSEEPYRSRYAERMATPWLDAARYADTCGIHTDAGSQIWPWRDWVLHAFRDNLPFDRFVVEQLAGDLPHRQRHRGQGGRERLPAQATSRPTRGGAIAEECLVQYAVDRTATLGSVFLALTLGCARCAGTSTTDLAWTSTASTPSSTRSRSRASTRSSPIPTAPSSRR
jgi:hypothetical protein